MTTRERWIVYPLLFLAIGLALRSGLILQEMERRQVAEKSPRVLDTDVIQCKSIQCLGGITCKGVQILAANGAPVVTLRPDATTNAGLIETRRNDGKIQSIILSEPTGGAINLFSTDATNFVELVTDGEYIRLISADFEKNKRTLRSEAIIMRAAAIEKGKTPSDKKSPKVPDDVKTQNKSEAEKTDDLPDESK